MTSKISNKDKEDWENFLSANENLPDKDDKLIKNKFNKIITFDLHGYSLDQANEKVKNLIASAYDKGFYKIIIVTGKGIHSTSDDDAYISKNLGKLKYSVPEFIKTSEFNKFIISINGAEKKDGGEGAIIIKLKNL